MKVLGLTFPKMSRMLIVLLLVMPALIWAQQSDSTARKSSFAIYPAIAYTPETNLIFGPIAVMTLKSRDESQTEFLRQSTFTPVAIYTLRNQFLTELNLQYFFKNGNNLNTTPGYFVFPDFYFGIGNDNDPDISESYLNRYFQIGGQFYFPLSTTLFLGTAFDFNSAQLQGVVNGGLLQTDNPVGIDGGTFFGIGPAIKLDSRNNSIYPTKGNLFAFQSLITKIGSFNYSNARLDLRKYVSVRNEKNIVAFQFVSQVTTGSQVPFYRLPQLGGAQQLRGIANASLYRDQQMVFSQVEYRRHVWRRFGMVAFAGMGDVMPYWSALDLADLKYIGGLGARFQVLPDEKMNLRMDIGFSKNGQSGFYVGMQEVF